MTDTSSPLVTSGARCGCGYRQPGVAYFAIPLGLGGCPLEEFLVDPPVVIDDPARLGVASVGVTLIERDGVTHVMDMVGRERYPTVASFPASSRGEGGARRSRSSPRPASGRRRRTSMHWSSADGRPAVARYLAG